VGAINLESAADAGACAAAVDQLEVPPPREISVLRKWFVREKHTSRFLH